MILVSGGIDSSYVALKFFEKGIKASLLHNNTHLQLSSAKKVIKALVKKTDYTLITIEPNVNIKNVLLSSFRALDKAATDKNSGKYNREVFDCCFELKKKPAQKFYKNLKENTLVVSSITPGESNRRRMFLGKIRNQGKWIINHSKYRVHFAYPLRDARLKKENLHRKRYAQKKLGVEVKSSGCRICPIVLLFKMWDKDPQTYARSKKFFLEHFQNMKFCGSLPIELDHFL